MSRLFSIILSLSLTVISICATTPTVSIVTIGPGSEVYELEGHTLMHIDDGEGLDLGVSWGVFDFDSPNFLYRFVKGETDYIAAAYVWQDLLDEYARSGRSVDEQIINLTDSETRNLINAVHNNIRPENRTYRYNYVKDNCATRPLEMIEKAIGAKLSSPVDSLTTRTWRSEMTRFHHEYPWYQFGIDLALGSGIDHNITTREMCYSPVNMHDYLATATRPDGSPIVLSSRRILPETLSATTSSIWQSPTVISWLILMLTMWIAMRGIARKNINRVYTSILFTISGIAGLILTFLIFISVHEATTPNWLYLWLNPLAFIAAIGVWLKKLNHVVYCYQIVNFACLIILLLTGIIGTQALNPAFYPLIASYLTLSAANIFIYRCQ